MRKLLLTALLLFIQTFIHAQKPRARDIGIPFDGTTGKFNAITDVKGVEVGYSTIIFGQGKNEITAILQTWMRFVLPLLVILTLIRTAFLFDGQYF
jgi:hypothetical protein